MRALRLTAWQKFAALGAVLGCVYLAPVGDAKAAAYFALIVSTVATLWRRRQEFADHRRRGWTLIAIGMSSSLVANTFYVIYYLRYGVLAPPPSVADLFQLTGLACVGVGMHKLLPREAVRRRSVDALDAAIVTIGVAVILFVTVLDGIVTDGSKTVIARTILLMYPAFDLVLMHLLARRLDAIRFRNPSELALLAGLGGLLFSDIAYTALFANGTYVAGGLADVGWLGWHIALGVAVLHPSAASAGEAQVETSRTPTPGRIGVIAATWLACAAPLAWPSVRSDRDAAIVALLGLATIFLLSLARLYRVGQHVQDRMTELGTLAAHELQTPMTTVLGVLNTLGRYPMLPLETRIELVELAERQATRLAKLTTDLAVLARVDLVTGASERFAVRAAVEEALLDLDVDERSRVVLEMGREVQVHGSRERLKHSIRNLLVDSLGRAATDATIQLSVSQLGGVASVRVRTAKPMRFASADVIAAAIPDQVRGLGVGVTIAGSLVRAMGGQLRLERHADGGGSATVVLPLAY